MNICGLGRLFEWSIHPPAAVGEFTSFGSARHHNRMRKRHPRILLLHWSKNAYHVEGDPHAWLDRNKDDPDETEPTQSSIPLYPRIKLTGPNRFELAELFTPKRDCAVPHFDLIEVEGPVSDDVLPIVFGYDHPGVYVRSDVAEYLQPHMSSSQRLIPVRCDGDAIPYLALTDPTPQCWLPEDWCYTPCEERSAPEFHDGATIINSIFPDAFASAQAVHFVGNYGNFFLDMVVWNSLRKKVPSIAHWLSAARIVVDELHPNDRSAEHNTRADL
jgi:hypothetical protein